MGAKAIITADLHGNINSWLFIRTLLKPEDFLIIAGDLFDTRYGNTSSPSFDPEAIKKELQLLPNPFFYVYGNCDVPAFFPGYANQLDFTVFNRSVHLHHGHRPATAGKNYDIIIQGHTHLSALDNQNGKIKLNPGSVTHPRNGIYSYATMDEDRVCLIDIRNGNRMASIDFA